MKSFIALSLFVFSYSYANQESCLKTTDAENEAVLICSEADNFKYLAFNCSNRSEICFTGNSSELVTKLNSNVFGDEDGALGNAEEMGDERISFYFGDVGSICQHQAAMCSE